MNRYRVLRRWVLIAGAMLAFVAVRQTSTLFAQPESDFHLYLPAIYEKRVNPCTLPPQLLEPAAGATLDTLNPLFRWSHAADADATLSLVYLSPDPSFESGSMIIRAFYQRYYQLLLPNLEPATRYYWRVSVSCGEADSLLSETWSFTTGSGGTILPGPSLTNPADGATVPNPVTLSWEPVEGAIEYVIEFTEEGYCPRLIRKSGTFLYSIYVEPGLGYAWRVAARNDYATGTFSARRTFTVSD